jgi:hypothetical protein
MAGKLGRKPPHDNVSHPRIYLDDFFTKSQELPTHVDFVSEVPSWPMSLNDQLGDCTIAAANHTQMAWNQYANGSNTAWSDNTCLEAYEAIGGYVPGDPSTDNGCVMQDVLDYWRKTGIGGDKILAFGALRNWTRSVRVQALYTFGSIYTGVNLPESAETQFEDHTAWVPAGGSIAGGHCINQQAELLALDEVRYITWGAVQPANRAWVMDYVEEAWCIISQDFIEANGENPDGFNLGAMNAELSGLTGIANPLGLNYGRTL